MRKNYSISIPICPKWSDTVRTIQARYVFDIFLPQHALALTETMVAGIILIQACSWKADAVEIIQIQFRFA